MNKDLSVVFEDEPKRWGLRGDPYLWAELKEESKGQAFPSSVDEIVEIVCIKFASVSGVPLTYDARPYVEKYAHGGMSSGHLSGLFWIGRGMAKILENYRAADKAAES